MAIAEIESESVITNLLPTEDLYAGIIGLLVTTILLAKDVSLASRFRAW